MDLEALGTFNEHEGQPLIHLIHVQKSQIRVEQGAAVSGPTSLVRLVFFSNATRIESQQFILLIKYRSWPNFLPKEGRII
jgi:hypothetical protein